MCVACVCRVCVTVHMWPCTVYHPSCMHALLTRMQGGVARRLADYMALQGTATGMRSQLFKGGGRLLEPRLWANHMQRGSVAPSGTASTQVPCLLSPDIVGLTWQHLAVAGSPRVPVLQPPRFAHAGLQPLTKMSRVWRRTGDWRNRSSRDYKCQCYFISMFFA
jgi:hypothetical protein